MTRLEKDIVVRACIEYEKNQKEKAEAYSKAENYSAASQARANAMIAYAVADTFQSILDAPCGSVRI